MTLVRTVRVVVLLALCASVAHAQQRDADARLAYAQGREAYQGGKYELALQKFRFCYTLSGEPALLYNVSAALQNLNRPGEAADALQQYLTARPVDLQRAEIELRITRLRQAQTMLDQEAQHQKTIDPARPPAIIFTAPPSGWMSDTEADKLMADIRMKERRRHRDLGVGLGVGLGLIAVGGIVVGAVCGSGHCAAEKKDWDFGKNAVTP